MNLKKVVEKNCALYMTMMRNMTNGAWNGSVCEIYTKLKKDKELKDTDKRDSE